MSFVHELCDGSKADSETQQAPSSVGKEPETIFNPFSGHPDSINAKSPGGEDTLIQQGHQPLPQLSLSNLSNNQSSSPISLPSEDPPSLSLREASLIRCFIQKIAPWVGLPPLLVLLATKFLNLTPRRQISAIPNPISVRLFHEGLCKFQWFSRQYSLLQPATMRF